MPEWPFRLLLVGGTGSGKTNLMMNLLFKWLMYDKIYINARHWEDDSKYALLKSHIDAIENDPAYKNVLQLPIAHWSKSMAEAIKVDDMDKTIKNLVIFDDLLLDNQKEIIEFMIRGRHKNCSIIYLAQTYFDIPKIIRMQASHLAFFDLATEEEMRFMTRYYSRGIDKDIFYKMFCEAVKIPHNFFYMDLTQRLIPLRFRRNFNGLLTYDVKGDRSLDKVIDEAEEEEE